MRDNPEVKVRFKATTEKVAVSGMEVTVPEVWYIDAWNNLGPYYVGITTHDKNPYSVKINPQNATNKSVTWTSHNPEIAHYMETFNNGFVPEKAGVAKFTVSANDNPSITEDVTIEFRYKTPLESVTTAQEAYTIDKNQQIDFKPNFTPHNATEQRFIWTYSQEGIVKITENVTSGSADGTDHEVLRKMRGLESGTVTVTGTPWDTTAGAQPIRFTVTVKGSGSVEPVDYGKMAKDALKHGQKYLENESISKKEYGDEWSIFSTLRSGGTIDQKELDAYYTSVSEYVAKNITKMAPTDRARVIIALTTMGKNPRNVGGVDLIEKTYNDTKLEKHSSNQISFSLLALDTRKYEVPEDGLWNRDKLIKLLLTFQKASGGFGLNVSDNIDSTDMTAMVLQSLAPYNNSEHPDVQAAFDKGLKYIQNKMTGEAGYIEGGSENSCTAAQVLTLLSAANIDPLKVSNGFVAGDKNLITNLNSFKLESGGFKTYSKGTDKADTMSTQQVTYALEAYDRFVNGKNSLY
ncbi:MAG: prenyltransferase/squalene oxidase repeat-containing protein, partial [Eubacterium sp.]